MAIAVTSVVAVGPVASAQDRGAVVIVQVADAASRMLVAGAHVSVVGGRASTVTDSLGQARLERVQAGLQTIRVRRIGYGPLSTPVKLTDRDSLEVLFLLLPSAQQLEAVTVMDSAPSPWLREFDERRRRGTGRYITGDEIRARHGSALRDVVNGKIPGIEVVHKTGSPTRVFSRRGVEGSCPVMMFLDGSPVADAEQVPLSLIGGIEFYTPGQIPVQYKQVRDRNNAYGNADCGVLLLWTGP